MDLQLRAVRRRDVDRLVGLLEQLGYPTTGADVHERLDYLLDEPSIRLIGADDGGELVGVAALGVLPMLEVTGRLGRVLALVVDERYRSLGVGQALVAAAEEQARAAGCVKMEITSSRDRTRTQLFYQQLGYTDICTASARFVKPLTEA
ncbi:GNAT family N-acetyltransferase [Dactylosporangium sp. NPDC051541]|uniref:GNAT family N-acetyltransferase n=1 Tax=Dactylosporangium sp. NPDC051541 TaxID=3363977 RepID=UPI00379DE4AB